MFVLEKYQAQIALCWFVCLSGMVLASKELAETEAEELLDEDEAEADSASEMEMLHDISSKLPWLILPLVSIYAATSQHLPLLRRYSRRVSPRKSFLASKPSNILIFDLLTYVLMSMMYACTYKCT